MIGRAGVVPMAPVLWSPVLWSLLALGACTDRDPRPGQQLWLEVELGVQEIGFGRGFPVTVVRGWRTNLVPEPWDGRLLAPLLLHEEAVTRRQGADWVEETRRYRAHAFVLGELVLPAPQFAARRVAGTGEELARGRELALRVSSALGEDGGADAGGAGAAELPGEPLPAPGGGRRWVAVGTVVVLGALLGAWRIRRRGRRAAADDRAAELPSPLPAIQPAASDPHLRALARLEELRQRPPADEAAVSAWYVAAAALLRDYLAARFGIPATARTTEESLDALSGGAPHPGEGPRRARLGRALEACDLVKFARARPAQSAHEQWLGEAERFVRETAASRTPPQENGTA